MLDERGLMICVAESLTGGLLVQVLARQKGASGWLAGGVVAYSRELKQDALGVTAEEVVSAQAVEEMASGVKQLSRADVAVALTGVAGPDREDDQPPGTIWLCVATAAGQSPATLIEATGSPTEICQQAVRAALDATTAAVKALDAA